MRDADLSGCTIPNGSTKTDAIHQLGSSQPISKRRRQGRCHNDRQQRATEWYVSFIKACSLCVTASYTYERPVYHPHSATRQWKSPHVWVQSALQCRSLFGSIGVMIMNIHRSSANRLLLPMSGWLSKLWLFASTVVDDDDKTANAEESFDIIIIARVLRRRRRLES